MSNEGHIQVVLAPEIREWFEEELNRRGLYLFRIPLAEDADDLPTYGVGVRWEQHER